VTDDGARCGVSLEGVTGQNDGTPLPVIVQKRERPFNLRHHRTWRRSPLTASLIPPDRAMGLGG